MAYDVLSLGNAELELAQRDRARPDEAFALLDQAVSLDPFNATVRLFVADQYDRWGYSDRALAERLTVYCWHIACR